MTPRTSLAKNEEPSQCFSTQNRFEGGNMSIINRLRDPVWQGIGAILIFIGILVAVLLVPDARGWLMQALADLIKMLTSALPTITFLLVVLLLLWQAVLTWTLIKRNTVSKDREFKDDFQHGLIHWTCRGDWRNILDGRDYVLTVTRSDDGGFANPCRLWNDYIFEFDTKIVNNNSSWIIRASSLAQYVMLQCGQTELNPHFRLQNIWFKLDPIPISPALPLNQWFHVQIKVEGTRVVVFFPQNGKQQTIMDRPLLDPVYTPVYEMLVLPNRTWNWSPQKTGFITPEYPTGSVGFRESGFECAHFRKVRVVKI